MTDYIEVMRYVFESGNCSMKYLCEHCDKDAENILYFRYPCTPEFVKKFCAIYKIDSGMLHRADLTEIKQSKENLEKSNYKLMESLRGVR